MVRVLTPIALVFVPPAMRDRFRRRVAQLLVGLVLYGASDSLLVLAHLGIDPWDVFQQGLALHTGLTIGTWAILVGGAVLFLWIPLRQRPGLGTLLNVLVIGNVMNLILAHVAPPTGLVARIVVLFWEWRSMEWPPAVISERAWVQDRVMALWSGLRRAAYHCGLCAQR